MAASAKLKLSPLTEAAVDWVDLGCVYIIKPALFKSDCFGQIVCRDSLHSQTFT